MLRTLLALILITPVLAIAPACSGSSAQVAPVGVEVPPPTQAEDAELAQKLDAYVRSYGVERGEGYRFSGHVHVVKAGKVVYSRGFEHANREAKAANGADTSFRIGSVTKQFTATAIFLLEKEGKLKFTDSVKTHIPDYPSPAGDQVTIQHLLHHTGGVPSYTNNEAVMKRRSETFTTESLMATFRDLPLEFAPGERFEYSNSGYVLLGAIIEKVSGKSYAEYMQEMVFAPAGLESTTVGDAESATDRALGYQTDNDGKVVAADPISMTVPHAAGAIRSTSSDLAKWHAVLASGAIIDAAQQQRMLITSEVSKQTAGSKTSGYGAGWNVAIDGEKNRTVVSHGGGIDGFSTAFIRVPADDTVIVAWSNNPTIQSQPMARAALSALYGESIEPHIENAIVALDPTDVARLVGTYELTAESEKDAIAKGIPAEILDTIRSVEIAAFGKSIQVKPAKQEPIPFEAESATVFVFTQAGIRIEFALGADGKAEKATTLTIKQGPLTLVLNRKS